MKKCSKTRFILVLLLFFVFVLGCIPETRVIPAPPRPEVIAPLPFSISVLDEKIAYLEKILRDSQLSNKDMEMAAELLSTYRIVRGYFLGKSIDLDDDKLIQKLYETLVRLDDECFLKQEKRKLPYSEAITASSEAQDMIRNKYFSGDYQGVIDDTMELETFFGPGAVPSDIRLLLAVSLAKRGRLEKAAIVGERILRELEERPDLAFILTHLKEMIRNKYFSGDYQGVIDDAIEIMAVFGPGAVSVDIVFLLAVSLEEIGMKGKANILGGRLIREFEASPDLAFLQNHLVEWQLDPGNKERVLQIYRELTDHMDEIMKEYQSDEVIEGLFKELVGERIQREKDARLDYEEETLTRAQELIQGEQYEEAIKSINELRDDRDMTLEMKELKNLAIEGLIKQERNRAATYLLRGRQTKDPVKKREFFLLSYNRLRALTEQYPTSSLIETLNRDMETVKTELDKLENDVED